MQRGAVGVCYPFPIAPPVRGIKHVPFLRLYCFRAGSVGRVGGIFRQAGFGRAAGRQPGSSAPTIATGPPGANADLEEAAKAFGQRKFDDATRLLEKAAKAHSELPPPPAVMADWFARVNQPAAMRQSLEQAVKNYAADPQAYIMLGNLALSEGRLTDAELEFAKAQELLNTFTKSAERKKLLEPATIIGLAGVAEARQKWGEAQKGTRGVSPFESERRRARCSGWPTCSSSSKTPRRP